VYGADAEIAFPAYKSGGSFASVSACGGYFSAKPDLSKFSADFYSGWGEVKVSSPKLDFSVGTFGAGLPGETKILNGKPRFLLKNGEFSGVYSSFALHFQDNITLENEIFALSGGFDWGDMYYFYGHPDSIEFYSGRTSLLLPFGTELSAYFARLETDIHADNTDEYARLGNAAGNFFFLSLEKHLIGDDSVFWQSMRHFFSARMIYCYAEVSGSVLATSETQDYFFFPYERIYGHLNDKFNVAGLGFSYEYKRPSLKVLLDTNYFHCFVNGPDANYSYKYKKNIFFDGSATSKDFDFADFTNCGFFAGKLSVSYNAKTVLKLQRVEPELRLSRIFVLPLLTDTAKNGLKTKLSSSASSSSGLSSSKNLQKIKTVLLSGTIFSLKIKF